MNKRNTKTGQKKGGGGEAEATRSARQGQMGQTTGASLGRIKHPQLGEKKDKKRGGQMGQ
jgi:hypothetical protein